jgi:hypothetical protein
VSKIKFVIVLVVTFVIAQYLKDTAHSISLYALVTLPGTFLHELMHYTMAGLLGGHPGNFSLIPSGNTLGSVTFVPNWYNAASVGLAPLLLAPLTVFFAALSSRSNNPLKMVGGGYLAACSWVACTPSSQDFSVALVPTSWPLALSILWFTTWVIYRVVRVAIR